MRLHTGFGGAVLAATMSTGEWAAKSPSRKHVVGGVPHVTAWCPLGGHVDVPVSFEEVELVVVDGVPASTPVKRPETRLSVVAA